MKNIKVDSVLKEVAKRHGVTVDHVRHEIQRSIDDAISNPDPAIQAEWAAIPSAGVKPTVEEFIIYIASKL